MKMQLNGVDVFGGECSSLYARNASNAGENHDHDNSSCKLEYMLPDLSAGDIISFTAHRETEAATADVVRLANEPAQLIIRKNR